MAEIRIPITDAEAKRTIEQLQSRNGELQTKHDELVKENIDLDLRVSDCKSDIATLEEEVNAQKGRVEDLQVINGDLKGKLERERQDRDAAETELRTVRAKLNAELKAEKERAEAKIEGLTKSVEYLETWKAEWEEDLEKHPAMIALRASEKFANDERIRAEKQSEKHIVHIEELEKDLHAARESAEKDKVILEERYNGYIRAVSDRDEARLRGKQLRIECEKQRKEIQELIYLRDEAIQTGKTYCLEDHAGLVQYEEDEAREPTAEEEVAKTWREAANKAVKECEELKAEIAELKGSKPVPVARITELTAQLDDADNHIDSLTAQIKDADRTNTELRGEKRNLTIQVQKLQDTLHTVRKDVQDWVDLGVCSAPDWLKPDDISVVEHHSKVDLLQQQLETDRTINLNLAQKIDEKDEYIKACEEEMESMREKLENNPEIKLLKEVKGRIQDQRDVARAEQRKLQDEVHKLQTEINRLRGSIEDLTSDKKKLMKRIDVLNSEHVTELDELIGELEVKRDELKTLSEKFEETLKEQKRLEEKVSNLNAESESLSNSEANARRHWDIAFRACAGYQEDIGKFKNSHEASKHEIERLTLKVKSLQVADEVNTSVIKEQREELNALRTADKNLHATIKSLREAKDAEE